MEEQAPSPAAPLDDGLGDGFAQALADQRGRVQQFAVAYRRQLAEIEARLESDLAVVAIALEPDGRPTTEDDAERARREAEQQARLVRLAQLESRLEEFPSQLAQSLMDARAQQQDLLEAFRVREEQLDARLAELAATTRSVRTAEDDLEARRREQQAVADELARAKTRWESRCRELETESQVLAESRARLKSQRAELADVLSQRRQEMLAELDRRQAELERQFAAREASLMDALDAARRQAETASRELAGMVQERDAHGRSAEEAQRRLASLEQQFHDLIEANDALRQEVARRVALVQQVEEQRFALAAERPALALELAQSREERNDAHRRLASLERQFHELTTTHDALRQEVVQRTAALQESDGRHAALTAERQAQALELAQAREQRDAAHRRLASLEQQFHELAATHDALRQDAVRRTASAQEAEERHAALAADRHALHGQLSEARAERDEARRLLAVVEHRAQELGRQLAASPTGPDPAAQAELARQLGLARQETQRLGQQLAQAHEQLSQRPEAAAGDSEELRQRLKMAVDDLKAEKARTADLQKKLAQAPTPAAPAGGMDWESQKRRMLAALEADGEPTEPEAAAERVRIEEAIRATEQVLAERDLEINELKELLQQQSSHLGSMAVGAAAVAEVLNTDEIVRQERENLQGLQDEWRGKLRQAEIDISVERAKLARERADLEEKLRTLEHDRSAAAKTPPAGGKKGQEPPVRGRWLSRLGLKDSPE